MAGNDSGGENRFVVSRDFKLPHTQCTDVIDYTKS